MVSEIKFKDQLVGENAFYNHVDYERNTQNDFSKTKFKSNPVYSYETEKKIIRVAKIILAIIIFPIGIYKLIHALVGLIVVPGCLMGRVIFRKEISQLRKYLSESDFSENKMKMKRIALKVDGYVIDGMILGTEKTLGNGRWILKTGGNGELYEGAICANSKLADELDSNLITFNYSGVQGSSGMPNRAAMVKAYQAMLNFLEDEDSGIGANEVVSYGHSIGGGVQAEGIEKHELKDGIKYVFVKSKTFSSISDLCSKRIPLLGIIVKLLGWNFKTTESSKKLEAPEIVIQTVSYDGKYLDDGVIPPKASLAYTLPKNLNNKYIMRVKSNHNTPLINNDNIKLVGKIEEFLSS